LSVLVDTTVLLAAAVEAHGHHEPCIDWLTTTISDTDLFVSAHSLAELYAQFTRPGMFEMTPNDARQIIQRYATSMEVVALSESEYLDLIDDAVDQDVRYGLIYDLIHVHAAQKAGVDEIASINVRHFSKIWPPEHIIDPLNRS